jgi:hypothetical protein
LIGRNQTLLLIPFPSLRPYLVPLDEVQGVWFIVCCCGGNACFARRHGPLSAVSSTLLYIGTFV